LIAAALTVGADALWLVSLGDLIGKQGGIPVGAPFAAADSSRWTNLPVLGELLFAGLHHFGALGLPAAQLVVDGALLSLTAVGARRLGASDGSTAVVLLLVALGALPALGVARAQLLSLLPFVALLLLLRSEHARPTWRIGLTAPLVALWGNLHGAVLVGVAIVACYLLLSRARTQPGVSLVVMTAAVAALWLNPAGLRTGSYYSAVLTNVAAQRRTGLWAAVNLGSGFDVLLIATALLLIALMAESRRPAWEYLAAAGLAIATITASRHGVWLLLFCAAPAAVGLGRACAARRGAARASAMTRGRRYVSVVFATVMVVSAGSVLASRARSLRADEADASVIRSLAAGRVVLAPEPLAEALAAAGVRVWLSNPIDAFSRYDQSAYLDFLAGHGPAAERALSAADVVVATPGSSSAQLAISTGFTRIAHVGTFDVLDRP
jgi:hypothetical protein